MSCTAHYPYVVCIHSRLVCVHHTSIHYIASQTYNHFSNMSHVILLIMQQRLHLINLSHCVADMLLPNLQLDPFKKKTIAHFKSGGPVLKPVDLIPNSNDTWSYGQYYMCRSRNVLKNVSTLALHT